MNKYQYYIFVQICIHILAQQITIKMIVQIPRIGTSTYSRFRFRLIVIIHINYMHSILYIYIPMFIIHV